MNQQTILEAFENLNPDDVSCGSFCFGDDIRPVWENSGGVLLMCQDHRISTMSALVEEYPEYPYPLLDIDESTELGQALFWNMEELV